MTRRRPRFADSIAAEDHYSRVIAAWQVLGGLATIAGVMLGAYCGGRIQEGVDKTRIATAVRPVILHATCPKRLHGECYFSTDDGRRVEVTTRGDEAIPHLATPEPPVEIYYK